MQTTPPVTKESLYKRLEQLAKGVTYSDLQHFFYGAAEEITDEKDTAFFGLYRTVSG